MMTSRENDLWFSSQNTWCELALKIVTYKILVWEVGGGGVGRNVELLNCT